MSRSRFLRPGSGGLLAFAVVAAVGCSRDGLLPECENCEFWTQVTAGLGRFPEPHPTDPTYVLFSTVDKTPGAPDADRDTDEDVWLLERRAGDPASSLKWQLTDDVLGTGDNFAATWSPSGTQVAFVHTTAGGVYEIWRMPVALPAAPGDPPFLGAPERLVRDARDVAWRTETTIVFSRDDKLYSLDIPPVPGPPTALPRQLTFAPPTFASTESFVDRHPFFAADGAGIFNTTGRRNVADVVVRAFEVDDTVFPPDTISAAAWISYQAPGGNPAYPVFIGVDTLRTPTLLRSVPVDGGGIFRIGVRRDSRFLQDPRIQSYCDTTLILPADLQPGDIDTLSFYFHVIRGTLVIQSGISQTDIFWTRKDARETIADFTTDTRLDNVGERLVFQCLMPFAIGPDETIDTAVQETLIVSGARGSLRDTARVVVDPGRTTLVTLFPAGSISGTVAFADNPPVLPVARAEAYLSATGELLSGALTDASGAFLVSNVPSGNFHVVLQASGYQSVTVAGVVVTPPADTPLGQITLTPVPGTHLSARPAAVEAPARARARLLPEPRVLRREAAPPGTLLSPLRAEGDSTTIWRIDLDPASLVRPLLTPLVRVPGRVQNPVVTPEAAGGVRHMAYVSDATGEWKVYVQRLVGWAPDGEPIAVATPGTSDNLDCDRTVFHPRWVPGSGALRLLVTMADCPDNGFETLGFDDDPWAVGELRIWEAELPPGL